MSQQQRVLNKKLSQIFRINGLTVRPDAMQPLYDVLEGEPERAGKASTGESRLVPWNQSVGHVRERARNDCE